MRDARKHIPDQLFIGAADYSTYPAHNQSSQISNLELGFESVSSLKVAIISRGYRLRRSASLAIVMKRITLTKALVVKKAAFKRERSSVFTMLC